MNEFTEEKSLTICFNPECDKKIISKYAKKFCSRGCSAKFNNRKSPKRIGVKKPCKNCGNIIENNQNEHCRLCIEKRVYSPKVTLLSDAKTDRVRRRLLIEELGHRCQKCKRKAWNGFPITLELEHIDGNSDNNERENLDILCPNCHSQTPTYKSKNKGNGRHLRRERYKEGKSF